MAQTTRFVPQDYQGDPSHQQQLIGNSAFRVVDQPPLRRDAFPLRLQMNWILAFSIGKCIIGTILFISGLVSSVLARHETKIAYPVWCGLTILANGIVGCVLRCKKTKCLIATFFGLSITSLIFSITMLSFFSIELDFFVTLFKKTCHYTGSGSSSCYINTSSISKDTVIGLLSFLIVLVLFELACSIGSVVVSCKAYSKCCNTYNTNDCCAFVGCCECDCRPLNVQQAIQRPTPSYSTSQNIPMQQLAYERSQQTAYQPIQQRTQSNPCSGFVSFVINIPSYVFGAANGSQLSAINVNVRPFAYDQQVPLMGQDRSAEQAQGATSAAIGRSQPIQAPATRKKAK